MMAGAIRRYSMAREYELASLAFQDAADLFEMAEASQGDAERKAEAAAAKSMSEAFGHFSLATQLDQGGIANVG